MTERDTAPAFDRRTRLAFMVGLGLLMLLTYAPRLLQYAEVQADPDRFYAGEVVIASPDSFYWLRTARERVEAVADGPEEARDPATGGASPSGSEAPWLTRALAIAAEQSGANVYAVAPVFALVTSALFMIPVALFGLRSGWTAAGLVGAAVGANAAATYGRTSMFRIDTDALILLGLWTVSLLIACLRPAASLRRQVTIAIAAGLATAFVIGWHDKPVYALAYLMTVPLALLAARIPIPRVVLLTSVFALAVLPTNLVASFESLAHTLEVYAPTLAWNAPTAPEATPVEFEVGAGDAPRSLRALQDETATLLNEGQRLPVSVALSRFLAPAWLAGLGLAFAFAWCALAWQRVVPLAPILGLGLLGLVGSNRFLIFLAPFVGFGLGAVLDHGVRRLLARRDTAAPSGLVSTILAVPLAALLLPATLWGEDLRHPLSAAYLRKLQAARSVVPAGSAIWSHVGEGHVLRDQLRAETRLASIPDPEIGHLFLGALTDVDPARLERTLSYLEGHAREDVRRDFRNDYDALHEAIRTDRHAPPGDVFVALTRRSIRHFESHHRRGQWSPQSGWAPREPMLILACEPRAQGTARCLRDGRATRIDFRTGRVGRRTLSRIVYLLDGRIESDRSLPSDADAVLVVARGSNAPGFAAFLMSERAARSQLVEMYLFGRADTRRFELAYDGFPEVRLYRLRTGAKGEASARD